MATFEAHVKQAAHNLRFLENTVHAEPVFQDWSVTACFYTAVHLVNAHLAQHQLQYRSHNDVKHALSPYNKLSIAHLPEDEFVAYETLKMLSRRARYLVNEKNGRLLSEQPALIFDVHLAKALRHLDRLLVYFSGRYPACVLPKAQVACRGFSPAEKLVFLVVG